MRTKLFVVMAMVFTLSLAGTAMAQNATQDAYGGVLGNEDASDDGTVAVTQGADSLPFTGLEVGLIALAGFGLVTLGFAMRRSTRRADN